MITNTDRKYIAQLKYSKATTEDAFKLADQMRTREVLEVHRLAGKTPIEAALRSIKYSDEAIAVRKDEQLIMVTGVVPFSAMSKYTGGCASPWLLNCGEEEDFRHARHLLAGTKAVLERWRQRYSLLMNFVDAEYKQSLRWAEWAGFTVFPPAPCYGNVGPEFCRIEMKGEGYGSRGHRSSGRSS